MPLPEPGGDEVLVRVEAAGICRRDLHYRRGSSFAGPLPLTLGHETAGIAEEPVPIDTYRDLVGRETSIVGVSDHTRAEVEYALALEAGAINRVLDGLVEFGAGVRSVVVPGSAPPSRR